MQPEHHPVTSPSHYLIKGTNFQAIDITRHETFLRGNIIKYVLRAPYKGSELEDLMKAKQYLEWEITRVSLEQSLTQSTDHPQG